MLNNNSKLSTNFNIALVALSEQVGASKAVEVFFDVLDRKVESSMAKELVKGFFDEVKLMPGEYKNHRYSNELEMQKILASKLDKITNQTRIL